jgi:hypothetical protein
MTNYLYFLTQLVNKNPDNDLIKYLFNTDYIWTLPDDVNRAQDGIDLRCWWANGKGLDKNRYELIFSNKPRCSVLELLVSFSNRIENDFMGDPNGDKTSLWFDMMLRNLGIFEDLITFDQGRVDHALLLFFDHKISLFGIPNADISLWNQMNYWLNYYGG